ncbi:retropepsin-like aspartic protease family protein [Parachitinimonas caeni]|uniref:TIGR02281 family clan AA aspartic protease n=1 Tax=Parachitinimonas caeni TaxID=3031301 RepID=A0ABT7E1T3_9NEIS|nr:TIGR02281 family clan AA aspartic protease [Parachitinimonas caeni]MDK2126276.1 TIGR02281 family clan AA aspartic protease [Parachitinimonas caeni]
MPSPSRLLSLMLLVASSPTWAGSPVLQAVLGSSKATLTLDGGKPFTLAKGESRQGVRLIDIMTDSVVVEVDGTRKTLKLGQDVFTPASSPGKTTSTAGGVTLFADGRGHYYASVSINNSGARGLIDTGASALVLSATHARQMGIDYAKGARITLHTAQGPTGAFRVQVSAVKIESIQLYGVDAVVLEGSFPSLPLIGMTVLNQLDMQRDGDTLRLSKRY